MSLPDPAKCFFCHEPNSEFCHGCGHYVCDDCDQTAPFGDHELGEHKLSEQDDDFSELDFNDED